VAQCPITGQCWGYAGRIGQRGVVTGQPCQPACFGVSTLLSMSNPDPHAKSTNWSLWVGLVLVLLTLLLAAAGLKLLQAPAQRLPVCGQIANFALTNQNGATVTLADLGGRVWVADIIFTRCPGPCLKMTRQMKELQDALPPGSRTRLVSLTTDPDFDTPEVLKAYAQRFGANPTRWMFLTGTKVQIANLAIDSLKLTAVAKPPGERQSPEDLFIHSTIFVIADKRGQLRGVFQTTGEGIDPQQAKAQILSAVRQLERES
jgi:protein SCO1